MTEQELAALEARATGYFDPNPDSPWDPDGAYVLSRAVPSLLAEVRRLRALLPVAEWEGLSNSGVNYCPWCHADGPPHRNDCPAFGSAT